ncbi:MAG: tetratricopeptide repeat protein [Acidobacteria bacterium]|nr:tetratricopeptide repeat protein [Acidobacteriota bacterium]
MKHRILLRGKPGMILAGLLFFAASPVSPGQTADKAASRLAKASRALEAGDLPAAEQTLTQVLKSAPDNATALNMLGVVRAQQQRTEEAQELFQRAIRANPKLAGPYGNLGVLYRNRNENERAMEMLQKAARLSPKDARVLYNLALLHGERGEVDAAVSRLKSIPVQQRPSDYWQVMSGLYISASRYAEAEETLRQALQHNPQSVTTLRQLAGVALKRNDTEAAWRCMLQARRIAPNSPELLFEYAQISLRNQLAAEAIVAMRKAVLLEPDRPEFLYFLGTALMESPMEYHEALPYFERYVKLKPDDPEGHGSLGWAYYTGKDLVNARKEIEESLRLQPDRLVAYYQLGVIAHESGDGARAEELLKKVIAREPDHADAHLTLGMVYARQGRFDQAREAFEAAGRLNPEEPKVHYQLSQIYRRLGNSAAAARETQLYQETLKKFRERNERSVSMPSAASSAPKPAKKDD